MSERREAWQDRPWPLPHNASRPNAPG